MKCINVQCRHGRKRYKLWSWPIIIVCHCYLTRLSHVPALSRRPPCVRSQTFHQSAVTSPKIAKSIGVRCTYFHMLQGQLELRRKEKRGMVFIVSGNDLVTSEGRERIAISYTHIYLDRQTSAHVSSTLKTIACAVGRRSDTGLQMPWQPKANCTSVISTYSEPTQWSQDWLKIKFGTYRVAERAYQTNQECHMNC